VQDDDVLAVTLTRDREVSQAKAMALQNDDGAASQGGVD
jgi:hypothetical protein